MDSKPGTDDPVTNINAKAEPGSISDLSCQATCDKPTYEPIKTFEALISYGEPETTARNGNDGEVEDIVDASLALPLREIHLGPGAPAATASPCAYPMKTVPLNKNFSETRVTLDGRLVTSSNCPKTLVCHDFKGGYGDDRFVDGTGNHENYIFRHWLQTDIFCYFSHHFITIPPLGWINAAHSHGVKVLGTIITEWKDGEKLCDEILKDSTTIDLVVSKLVLIAKSYGFEGYLVNIENELRKPQVPEMLQFLEKLTKAMQQLSSDNLVIWYDSVTVEGALKWQDCLNECNNAFFTACDGIYLNYNWDDEKLKLSVEKAGERKFDVFVGVDVFGRGCFGGGGLNTCLAVEKVYNYQLSYAIFAPGWSFECNPYDSFHQMDDALWVPCSKYFYFHCLKDEFYPTNRFELLSPTSLDSTTCKKFKVFFSSNLSMGYGTKCFAFGQEPNCQSWFDMSRQSFQPVLLLSSDNTYQYLSIVNPVSTSPEEKVFYDVSKGFSGGGSLRICNYKRSPNYVNPFKACPIWFPLQIPFSSNDSNRMSIAVLAVWKSASVDHQLQIYLEVAQKSGQSKKILLGSVDHLAASVGGKYYIHLKLSHFFPECNGNSGGGKEEVEFFFRKNNYDEKEVNGWRISCFLFDLDETQIQKYTGINSIKVGAIGDVNLGFLSLAQIIHYTDQQ